MKARILLIVSLSLLLAVMLAITAGIALATVAPFHPGQPLYDLQGSAEHAYLDLLRNPEQRALFSLTLLERRVQALDAVAGTPAELDLLTAAYGEIDRALALFQAVPTSSAAALRETLARDLDDLLARLDRLSYTPSASPQGYNRFRNYVLALAQQVRDASIPMAELYDQAHAGASAAGLPATPSAGGVTLAPTQPVSIDPRMVLFPPGSPGAEHAFFPLTGAHALQQCQNCHSQGLYAGTLNRCTDCHTDVRPAGHFGGECALCHSTNAWLPANFDHQAANAVDCASCHGKDKPANHYNGQCSACHSTAAWQPAHFNHQVAGAVDCISCHSAKKPANHFSGQCSLCHSTTAWQGARFNHAAMGAVDCASCHGGDKPANHFSGQCSSCHSTDAWRPANFNHQAAGATDCASCHSANKPANHFGGQCSACHSTNAWKPASFNHQVAGAVDCASCHSRPANHFSGQCSQCHSTNAWLPANFSHSFPLDHGGANGNCSTCHPGGGSGFTCFNCHNQSELDKKHNEKGIPDWIDRCMDCHADGRKHD